jgi:transcriptional regulator with XRE-family HTH domain
MTQKQLSELTGISMRSIQRLDWGELENPPIGYLVNIAVVLDIPVLDICEDEWLDWTVFDASAPEPPPKGHRVPERG